MSDAEELAKLDLRLRRKQIRWEDGRAIAMIALAFAAAFAAGGFANWFRASQPQTIVVRFEQPLAVKLVP